MGSKKHSELASLEWSPKSLEGNGSSNLPPSLLSKRNVLESCELQGCSNLDYAEMQQWGDGMERAADRRVDLRHPASCERDVLSKPFSLFQDLNPLTCSADSHVMRHALSCTASGNVQGGDFSGKRVALKSGTLKYSVSFFDTVIPLLQNLLKKMS